MPDYPLTHKPRSLRPQPPQPKLPPHYAVGVENGRGVSMLFGPFPSVQTCLDYVPAEDGLRYHLYLLDHRGTLELYAWDHERRLWVLQESNEPHTT